MNLILLEKTVSTLTWDRHDRRAQHLKKVLRPAPGDRIDVGCINGPRGKATIVECSKNGDWTLTLEWGSPPDPLLPLDLLLGLPRPQTARKLLNTATTLGARRLLFFSTEKGESSYAESKLWKTGEWQRHLIEGAEQAFSTWLPEVRHFSDLAGALESLSGLSSSRVVLDNYEGEASFRNTASTGLPMILALGSECGWSPQERTLFRNANFQFFGLGERVLRTETALAYALGAILEN